MLDPLQPLAKQRSIHSAEHITWLRGWHGPLEYHVPLRANGRCHPRNHVMCSSECRARDPAFDTSSDGLRGASPVEVAAPLDPRGGPDGAQQDLG